eukprot:3489082-Rhodomonas_salina.1
MRETLACAKVCVRAGQWQRRSELGQLGREQRTLCVSVPGNITIQSHEGVTHWDAEGEVVAASIEDLKCDGKPGGTARTDSRRRLRAEQLMRDRLSGRLEEQEGVRGPAGDAEGVGEDGGEREADDGEAELVEACLGRRNPSEDRSAAHQRHHPELRRAGFGLVAESDGDEARGRGRAQGVRERVCELDGRLEERLKCLVGLRVAGLEIGVWGFGYGVWGLGFGVLGSGSKFGVQFWGLRQRDCRQGLGFRV